MSTTNYAIMYHALSFSALSPQPKEKRPFPNFPLEKYFNQRARDAELSQRFKEAQDNIAIISGKISGLYALDIDGQLTHKTPHKCIEATA